MDAMLGMDADFSAEKHFPQGQMPRWMQVDGLSEKSTTRWVESLFNSGDGDVVRLWMATGFLKDVPGWLLDLVDRERSNAAELFVVSGDVNDYAFDPGDGYIPVIQLIANTTAELKERAIGYSLSGRFQALSGQSHSQLEDLFIELGRNEGEARNPSTINSSVQDKLLSDFRIMELILRASRNQGICLIIENVDLMLSQDSRDLERNVLADAPLRWTQDRDISRSRNMIVMLAEAADAINSVMRSHGVRIEGIQVECPDTREERLKFLAALFAGPGVASMDYIRLSHGSRPRFDEEFGPYIDSQFSALADQTSGLTLVELENLILQANNLENRTITGDLVRREKREMLKQESAGPLNATIPLGLLAVGNPLPGRIWNVLGLDGRLQCLCYASSASDLQMPMRKGAHTRDGISSIPKETTCTSLFQLAADPGSSTKELWPLITRYSPTTLPTNPRVTTIRRYASRFL